jgi:hypothetical protein
VPYHCATTPALVILLIRYYATIIKKKIKKIIKIVLKRYYG